MATATASTTTGGGERRFTIGRILGTLGFIFLIIFALIETLPFAFTIVNSFKCLPTINGNPVAFIPVPPLNIDCVTEDGNVLTSSETSNGLTFNPSLDGYEEVFEANLGQWLINSIIFSVVITLCRILTDSLAGYALARIKFPGNRLFFFVILGTLMIPGVVLLIPRFIILQQLGMLNSYQGFIIPLAADAFGIFLMKQFFESIPTELEEAAQVDGANRFVMFFRVILPLATPAITALTIFSFQGVWNNFMDAIIIIGTNPDLWTLPLGLNSLRGQSGETLRWHQFLAGAVITTVPMAIVFFSFQRYFVEGSTYSGLAGQ
jgi:multiple sugar transport system permease protein